MSFSDCFSSCLSPLPSPSQFVDSVGELIEFLEKLHNSAESSGLSEETALPILVAAGAFTGVDETLLAAFAAAGALTLGAYISACAGCAVGCGAQSIGSSIWDAITASNDSYVRDKLTVAANEAQIPHDSAVA